MTLLHQRSNRIALLKFNEFSTYMVRNAVTLPSFSVKKGKQFSNQSLYVEPSQQSRLVNRTPASNVTQMLGNLG